MEPYLGQIMLQAFSFAPKGWARCDGQTLPINQNQALFSILGTTYGGDGITTFKLPDLRGRVAVNSGQGNNLNNVALGQAYGTPNVTLTTKELPAHTHTANASVTLPATSSNDEELDSPIDGVLRVTPTSNTYAVTAPDKMGSVTPNLTVEVSGSSMPINNIGPSLVLSYCIAMQGIYPSRN